MRKIKHRLCGYDRKDNAKYVLLLTPIQWEVLKVIIEGQNPETIIDYELDFVEINVIADIIGLSSVSKDLRYFFEAYYPAKV